jgi:hypothetical protein
MSAPRSKANRALPSTIEEVSKDALVAATLAVLGGETTGILERDLFLACWHSFPKLMRWADTALPNPDTFTASLRRLDADGIVVRSGKQQRRKRGVRRRAVALETGRSGAVRTQLRPNGLEKMGVAPDLIEQVRQLTPDPSKFQTVADPDLIVACIDASSEAVDEGSVVELAFHRFPQRFAYRLRPEFPDIAVIKAAINQAHQSGWLQDWRVTAAGRVRAAAVGERVKVTRTGADRVQVGTLRTAASIESTDGFRAYRDGGGLQATKPDELYRLLRVPPTTDPQPVVRALITRGNSLRRVGRGDLALYLFEVARRHNPDVAALATEEGDDVG